MTVTNREQRLVQEFHRAMGMPAPGDPTMLTAERSELRCRLIEEEAREFRDATAAGDWLEMVDALADLLYVTYGAAVEMGIDMTPYFDEVHRTNLAKEPSPPGEKCIKPDGWVAPDLAGVHARRYGDAPPPARDQGAAPSRH